MMRSVRWMRSVLVGLMCDVGDWRLTIDWNVSTRKIVNWTVSPQCSHSAGLSNCSCSHQSAYRPSHHHQTLFSNSTVNSNKHRSARTNLRPHLVECDMDHQQ